MVDIHCHILPGLDDGPDSLKLALEMAEMAIADGITHIVATPHANNEYAFIPDLVQNRRDELQGHLGNRLLLATGCDFHISFENLQDIYDRPTKYTLCQKNYLLVEFADYALPPNTDQMFHQLQLAGLHPIITHPERNPLIRANASRLNEWVRRGCFAQITAGSLLGRFGPQAKEAAETWLEQDAVHFVSTDAHNVTSRPPRVSEAFACVLALKGEEVARALFHENPLAAFEGRPLPYLPEPAEGKSGDRRPSGKRRKRFWIF